MTEIAVDRILKKQHMDILCARQEGGCGRSFDVDLNTEQIKVEKRDYTTGYDTSPDIRTYYYFHCPACERKIAIKANDLQKCGYKVK